MNVDVLQPDVNEGEMFFAPARGSETQRLVGHRLVVDVQEPRAQPVAQRQQLSDETYLAVETALLTEVNLPWFTTELHTTFFFDLLGQDLAFFPRKRQRAFVDACQHHVRPFQPLGSMQRRQRHHVLLVAALGQADDDRDRLRLPWPSS